MKTGRAGASANGSSAVRRCVPLVARRDGGGVVEDLARDRARLRESARAALGVSGGAEIPSLREGVRTSGAGWYPLVALGLLVIVDEFQGYAFFVLGPEISATLGIGKSALAGVALLKTLAITLAALPMAAYVQRRARRAVVSKVTAFAWGTTTLFTGFVTGMWGLAGVLVADGAATGSVRAVHPSLLMDTYPPGVRVRTFSAYRAADAVGNMAAPLLVGLMTAVLGFTWRGVFLAMGAACLLVATASLRLRDPGFGWHDADAVRAIVRGSPTASSEKEVALGFFETVRRLLLIPTIRRVLAALSVLGMLVIPFNTFLFFFLDERWGMGPGERALLFAVVPLFSFPALSWFGRRGEESFARDPARLVRLTSTALLGIVAALAIAALSPVFLVMVAMIGAVFGLSAAVLPALNVITLSIVPARMRPHASALMGIAIAAIGGVGGLLLLGGVDRRFGVVGAIVSLTFPGIVAALVLSTAARTVNDDLDRMLDELVEREEIARLRRDGVRLPLLAARHVDFSYGQLQILFDVDFTVDDGQCVALLGTNGAGKSTLLRVVSGLGLPSRGSVHFDGADVTYVDAERRVRLGITQVPGGKAVFGPLSVVENLRVYGYAHQADRRAVDRGIEATFDAFPRLAERRNQPASTLSGGEQQMLALGKALVLRPRLLMIDELSLGLAPKVVGELLAMVRRINEAGTAIVLVEQSVNIALSIVDHAYFMEKGEIRFDGRATDLLARDDLLRSVFLDGASAGLRGARPR